MMRNRCQLKLTLSFGCLVAGACASPAIAQETDRGRASADAASQANEADRLFKLGEFEAALPLYEAERASRVTTGDLRYEAYALRAIGICRGELGDDIAAIASWRQAYVLDLKRDDPGYAGYDDFLIAQAEFRLGQTGDAIATMERALTRLTGAADRDHETDALLALTRILVVSGAAEKARPRVARALDLAQKANDAWRVADSLASMGQVEGALGHPDQALESFSKAQKAFDAQGRAAEAAWMETTSASALVLLNRPDQALARFEKAAQLPQAPRRRRARPRKTSPPWLDCTSKPVGSTRRSLRHRKRWIRPATPTTGFERWKLGSDSRRSRRPGTTGPRPPRPSTRRSFLFVRCRATTPPSRSGSS